MDEMGVLLGITRLYGRSPRGERVYQFKPFYRGARVNTIGAMSLKRVLALQSLDHSIKAEDVRAFIQDQLAPQLWPGAVVVMDNLAAHKVDGIEAAITAVGAQVVYLSTYSPEFNPIEHLWSQLKAFLRRFTPTTFAQVEQLLEIALMLCCPQDFRNYFAHCCYCTS